MNAYAAVHVSLFELVAIRSGNCLNGGPIIILNGKTQLQKNSAMRNLFILNTKLLKPNLPPTSFQTRGSFSC